jgi:hypothetical protein
MCFLGGNPKSSKQVQFIIWAVWHWVWGELEVSLESAFLGDTRIPCYWKMTRSRIFWEPAIGPLKAGNLMSKRSFVTQMSVEAVYSLGRMIWWGGTMGIYCISLWRNVWSKWIFSFRNGFCWKLNRTGNLDPSEISGLHITFFISLARVYRIYQRVTERVAIGRTLLSDAGISIVLHRISLIL